ncbi:MAG: serine/threonine protein kinase [Bryobacterales bacterium]|nr:serine/threonine protein kinase [Bryobacterales bacterium]
MESRDIPDERPWHTPADSGRWMPKQIGPYAVDRELGRGGMGVVYLARRADKQFQKLVAIKLMHTSLMDDEMLKRFRAERQILASLEHPNIARLLDGGTTEQGEPYFVMEYVRNAMPLRRHVDEQALPIRERLRLFRIVCGAVHYAHQRLVVHRDLKPANILVTEEGEIKLLDFGIAKQLIPVFGGEEAPHTRTGHAAMTPEYASPEQIRGEALGTTSDVYSLGVVLFDLLTGRLPFPSQENVISMMHAICEVEPPKPSTVVVSVEPPTNAPTTQRDRWKLSRELTGDLDNIVLRALEKDPERRYSSAMELSDDIGRYLEGLPVLARKASGFYRARKFAARHRAVIVSAAAAILLLIGGTVTTLIQARRAGQQRQIAQEQAREAQTQKALAEQMARLATEQAAQTRNERNRAETEAAAAEEQKKIAVAKAAEADRQRAMAQERLNEVREISESLIFDFSDSILNLPGANPARKLIVERAQKYLEAIAKNPSATFIDHARLATAYQQVAVIQRSRFLPNLGDTEGALKNYQKALSILEEARKKFGSNPSLELQEGMALNGLGDIRWLMGDPEGALKLYLEALTKNETLTLQPPTKPNSYRETMRTYAKIADMLADLGRGGEALPYIEKAAALSTRNSGYFPDMLIIQRDEWISMFRLGTHLLERGENQKALEKFRETIPLIEKGLKRSPESAQIQRDLMLADGRIGLALQRLGKLEEAMPYFERELKVCRDLYQRDTRNVLIGQDLVVTLVRYSSGVATQRSPSKALSYLREAVSIADQIVKVDTKSFQIASHQLSARRSLGETLADAGQWAEGDTVYSDLFRLLDSLTAVHKGAGVHRQIGEAHYSFAEYLRESAKQRKRPEELQRATEHYQKALSAYELAKDKKTYEEVAQLLRELKETSK